MAGDTKYITLENLARLAGKIKAGIQLKQDQLQFTELPDAAAYTDKVVQYVGDDTAELKAGAFYKSDGTAWTQVSVTETPEPVEQNLVIVGQLPAWADADASKVYAVRQAGVPYTTIYSALETSEEGLVLYPIGSNDPAVEVRPDKKMFNVFGPDVTEQNIPVVSAGNSGDLLYYLMPSAGFDEVYVPVPEGTDIESKRSEIEAHGARIVNSNWYVGPLSMFTDNVLRTKVHVTQKVPTLHEASVTYDEDKETYNNLAGSMFIVTEPAKHTLTFYAKKEDETDAWYATQNAGAAQPVDLPTFTAISDADIGAAFEA